MRERTLAVVIALISATLLAACTSVSPGSAEPASRTATTTEPGSRSTQAPTPTEPADQLPTDGAPKVANPLDTSKFQTDPCLSLTTVQSQELNVGVQGTPTDDPLGKACRWRNPETSGQIVLTFVDGNSRGLSALYRASKDGKFAYFQELIEIGGHPAVAANIVDDRPNGSCVVSVGATDKLIFEVDLTLSRANVGQKDSCEVAAQVAGMALQTMKAGG